MGLCFWRKAGGASTRIRRRIPVPVSEAGAGHSFAQAALFQEILLQSAELLIYEVIGLVDQADGNIGDHFGRAIVVLEPIVRVLRVADGDAGRIVGARP